MNGAARDADVIAVSQSDVPSMNKIIIMSYLYTETARAPEETLSSPILWEINIKLFWRPKEEDSKEGALSDVSRLGCCLWTKTGLYL